MKGFTYFLLVVAFLTPASWGQEAAAAPASSRNLAITVRYTPAEGGTPLFARIMSHESDDTATLPLRLPDGSLWIVEISFNEAIPQAVFLSIRDTSIMAPSATEARPLLLTEMTTASAFDGKPQKVFEWNEGVVELELSVNPAGN